MNAYEESLSKIAKLGLLRSLRKSEACGAKIKIGGKSYFNLACNDYLGLSSDLDLQNEFLRNLSGEAFIMGATSSRLLGGDNPAFGNFEAEVSEAFSKAGKAERQCLMFNGGYHANTGIIPALASSSDLVLCDKLVHASLIDAMRLSEAKCLRFPHNDIDSLSRILSKYRSAYDRVYIVTESVFSMDGDRADLMGLVNLKKEYNAALYVDEAHSFGLYGDGGLGLCCENSLIADVDFIMCTLGKAAASQGAFVVCDAPAKELLINRCRPFIFTTAIPPINAMWSSFVFGRFSSADFADRRARLFRIVRSFRKSLEGFRLLGDTQIIPLVIGENSAAVDVSKALFEMGIYAPAIRHPSVPKGAARIRMSLNADMGADEIDRCANIVEEIVSGL